MCAVDIRITDAKGRDRNEERNMKKGRVSGGRDKEMEERTINKD